MNETFRQRAMMTGLALVLSGTFLLYDPPAPVSSSLVQGNVVVDQSVTIMLPVDAFTIAYPDSALSPGRTAHLSAQGLLFGELIELNIEPSLTWSSSDPNVLDIAPDGMATALTVGQSIVTATYNDRVATALIVILEASSFERRSQPSSTSSPEAASTYLEPAPSAQPAPLPVEPPELSPTVISPPPPTPLQPIPSNTTDKFIETIDEVEWKDGISRGEAAYVFVEYLSLDSLYKTKLSRCNRDLKACLALFRSQSSYKDMRLTDPIQLYPDVPPTHPRYDAINTITQLRISSGYSFKKNSPFLPDKQLTRGEALVLLLETVELAEWHSFSETVVRLRLGEFTYYDYFPQDLVSYGLYYWWLYPFVDTALELGILNVKTYGVFLPYKLIEADEFVDWLIRVKGHLDAARVARQKDSDNDGLTDYEEIIFQTDPDAADSDNDGVSDYEEIIKDKTNPREKPQLNQDPQDIPARPIPQPQRKPPTQSLAALILHTDAYDVYGYTEPFETVELFVRDALGNEQYLGSVQADKNGGFSFESLIAELPPGDYFLYIRSVDSVGGDIKNSIPIYVTVADKTKLADLRPIAPSDPLPYPDSDVAEPETDLPNVTKKPIFEIRPSHGAASLLEQIQQPEITKGDDLSDFSNIITPRHGLKRARQRVGTVFGFLGILILAFTL